LTKTTAPGNAAAAGAAVTLTACDTVNFNQFTPGGNDLIVAQNTGGAPYTVTVTSSPDELGRLGTISAESIAAGEVRIYGPLKNLGWIQADGKVYLQASNVAVKFGVITLPG
jgi:hypothetical protein